MKLNYIAIPTDHAEALRAGQPDAYGLIAERIASSTGAGTPCRHCLEQVPAGKPYLLAAYRPFAGLHPYTETGPVFICADDCGRGSRSDLPVAILRGPAYILRGYTADEGIAPGTGRVVAPEQIPDDCAKLFADDSIAFIHIRHGGNSCFDFRVERGSADIRPFRP